MLQYLETRAKQKLLQPCPLKLQCCLWKCCFKDWDWVCDHSSAGVFNSICVAICQLTDKSEGISNLFLSKYKQVPPLIFDVVDTGRWFNFNTATLLLYKNKTRIQPTELSLILQRDGLKTRLNLWMIRWSLQLHAINHWMLLYCAWEDHIRTSPYITQSQ